MVNLEDDENYRSYYKIKPTNTADKFKELCYKYSVVTFSSNLQEGTSIAKEVKKAIGKDVKYKIDTRPNQETPSLGECFSSNVAYSIIINRKDKSKLEHILKTKIKDLVKYDFHNHYSTDRPLF